MRMRLLLLGVVILCAALTLAAQTGGPSGAAASLVLTGATVVDGTGGPPIANAVIVIRDGRIAAVGPAPRVRVPNGVQRLDLRGKTVLPGFVNAHGHVNETNGLQSGAQFNTRENVLRQLVLYAQYGVTSVFSLGGDGAAGLTLRDEPASGRARIFVSGAILSGKTAEAAAADVDALASAKVDWVKVRVDGHLGAASTPLAAAKGAIDRARSRGLPLAAHLYYLGDANQLLRDGVDLIAHSVRDKDVDGDFIRLARARDVCVVPTLMREVSTFVYETEPAFFADPFFQRHADTAAVEQLKTPARQQAYRTPAAQGNKAALEQASRNLKLLKDAGVRIAMGTDSGPAGRFQGYFEHMELELMVKAGLTSMQAIVAATGDAARCMKKSGQIGTIQPGAWADLVVYGASPVDDIRNTRTIEQVIIGGVPLAPPQQAGVDWTHWRGPNGNGVAPDRTLPLRWSATDNVAWKAPIAGTGVSTPIVSGDRVHVTSQIGAGIRRQGNHPRLVQGADAAAQGERAIEAAAGGDPGKTTFVIEAFGRADGKRIWERRIDAAGDLTPVHDKHNLATPSPVTDGAIVFAWFGTGQLVALDRSGAVVWQRHLATENGPFDIQWGHGSSPVVHGDMLILLCDQPARSYLVALDKKTGKDVWKADRGKGRASYSTPLVIEGAFGTEIIVNSTERIDAYDAKTGGFLWHSGETSRFAVPTPVFHNGVIYASRGYRSGPYMAIKPGGRGDVTATHTLWRIATGAPYVSSLLYYDGIVYMANDVGVLTAVDAATGERVWQERVDGVFSASPVAGGGHVYFVSESGETVVVKAGRAPQVVARNALGERAVASPAISNGRLFVRTDKHVFAIGQ